MVFIECIEEYNPNKKQKKWLKYFNSYPIVTELFIKERNLKISLVFIAHTYFVVPK